MRQNEMMIKLKNALVWTMCGLALIMLIGLLIKSTPSGAEGKNIFTLKYSTYYGQKSTTGFAIATLIMMITTTVLIWFKQSYLTLASFVTATVTFILSMCINGEVSNLYTKVGPGVILLTIFASFYYLAALGLLALTIYRLVRIGMRTHKFEIYPYQVVLEDVVRSPQGPVPTSGYGQQPYAQPQQPYAQPQQPYAQPQQPYAQPQQPYAQPQQTYAQPQQTYAQPTQQPYAQPQQPAAAPQETKFCTSCGTANTADSRFCSKCGSPLA